MKVTRQSHLPLPHMDRFGIAPGMEGFGAN